MSSAQVTLLYSYTQMRIRHREWFDAVLGEVL